MGIYYSTRVLPRDLFADDISLIGYNRSNHGKYKYYCNLPRAK